MHILTHTNTLTHRKRGVLSPRHAAPPEYKPHRTARRGREQARRQDVKMETEGESNREQGMDEGDGGSALRSAALETGGISGGTVLAEGSKGTGWVSLMRLCYSEIHSEDKQIIKIHVLFSGVLKILCPLVIFRQKLYFLQGIIMLVLKNTFLKKKNQSFYTIWKFWMLFTVCVSAIRSAILCYYFVFLNISNSTCFIFSGRFFFLCNITCTNCQCL